MSYSKANALSVAIKSPGLSKPLKPRHPIISDSAAQLRPYHNEAQLGHQLTRHRRLVFLDGLKSSSLPPLP